MGFPLDLVFIDFVLDLEWVFQLVWVAMVVVGLCWVGVFLFVFFFFAELLWSLGKRENPNEVESQTREKKREWGGERKNNKILNTHAIVTMHIYMVTIMHGYYSNCAFMHNFTPTDVGVFLLKMRKIMYLFFFFWNNFASTDAIALNIHQVYIFMSIFLHCKSLTWCSNVS